MKPLIWLFLATAAPLYAAEPNNALIERYSVETRAERPGFAGFSAERGRAFYLAKQNRNGKAISCASCHTEDPRREGLTPAFRKIGPMAPSANPTRFTDPKKVEKWFRRNCDDVLARECTPEEKGQFLTYLYSIR